VGQKQCRYKYDISGLVAHVLPADVLTPAPCSVAMEKEREVAREEITDASSDTRVSH